jgi:cbb3-type cytochrome oxidase cytochrome c subunit
MLTFLSIKEDRRLRSAQTAASRFDPILAAEGERLFVDNGCDGCHEQGGRKAGTGPSLIGATRRHSMEWLVMHFKDPKSLVPTSTMPKFDYLTDEEMIKLIHYMRSLRRKR